MRSITTTAVEDEIEKSQIYRLRYDYHVVSRELDIAADHVDGQMIEARDAHALQFATYAGDDLVGCFRIEIGAPADLRFGADWEFGDFLDDLPERVALIGGFCIAPHVRDERVIQHMVRECVAIAKEFELPQAFFELPPALWPLFHEAGLTRRGDTQPDRLTGLQTAVFRLDRSARVRFPAASGWAVDEAAGGQIRGEHGSETGRPRLQIVAGGLG